MVMVLDASYAVAIALAEDDLPGADEALERIASEGAVVPPLWRFEVANALLTAVRRKWIAPSSPAVILGDLACLAITIDDTSAARAWNETFALADRHGLTVYDAAYLELALRLGSTLASLDGDLIRAARREAIEVVH